MYNHVKDKNLQLIAEVQSKLQNLKGLAAKLNVDITTVYRHYKRLLNTKGKAFNDHTIMKRGRILLDRQAQLMILKSFRHKHISNSEKSLKSQFKIREVTLKSTINNLKNRSSNFVKTIKNQNKQILVLDKQLSEKQNTISKLLTELDHAQTIADNAQKSEKILDRRLTIRKPSGFLGWLKSHF